MKLLTAIFSILLTLQPPIPFTKRELEIIRNGDSTSPLRVLQTTDPEDSVTLRMKSEDININSITTDEDLRLLINRLIVTMEEEGGVGIAAPQVGVQKNIFIFTRIDRPDNPHQVAINPRITSHPDETVCFERDGCLSIPDISANSTRYPWVEVEYWDENGKHHKERLEGFSRNDNFTGVIFQHELDHLNGILFTDRICE